MTSKRFTTPEAFPFSRVSLKLEDKIILGALFLLSLLIFIGLANKFFNHFDEQNKRWEESIQKTQNTHNIAHKSQMSSMPQPAAPATDSLEESFYQVQKAFEENQNKREAAFKEMEKNFHERFKKTHKAYDKRSKNFFKRFDKVTAKARAEYEKKTAKLIQ